jgi:hypothetical protein
MVAFNLFTKRDARDDHTMAVSALGCGLCGQRINSPGLVPIQEVLFGRVVSRQRSLVSYHSDEGRGKQSFLAAKHFDHIVAKPGRS